MITWTYLDLGGGLAGLALLAAWMFTTSHHHVALKIAASVVSVGGALSIWLNATAMLGFAVSGMPPDGAQMIGVMGDREHQAIYLWVASDYGPRAYKIPYSEQLEQQIKTALKAAKGQGGGKIILHLDGRPSTKPPNGAGGKAGKAGANGLGKDDSLRPQVEVESLLPSKE